MFATCSYPEKCLVQDLGRILHSRATANIVCSKAATCYHSNKGRSGVNINGTIKLCNLYNPLFGATFMFLSLIFANFVLKFPNFRCYGNKDRSGVNFCDTDKLYDIDNPLIGATHLALCLILGALWLILC